MELFGVKEFFDGDLLKLAMRLSINLAFAFIVIRLVYFRLYRNREYVFTYFMFNIITFSTCFLLRKVPIELGFALGLFAVFGILRYRTEPIRIRDLTYLFVVIGIAIINALVSKKISLIELVTINCVIVGATAWLELSPGAGRERSRTVLYDDLSLLQPDKRQALLDDLTGRTGFKVQRIDINHIDLLRDSANLTVYYQEAEEDAK